MAAAPLVSVAVGAASSVAGIAQKSQQAKAQQAQLDVQATSIEDQRKLNQYQIAEQRRQTEAMAQRERMLNTQAQSLGLIQNEMQASQQAIAQTQAQIANDQQAFMNQQKATARQAQANMQAMEAMQQLQQVAQKGILSQNKTEQEANAIAAQRGLLQGGGASDTQSGQAFLERVMNAVASGVINDTTTFNGEMDDAQKQLAYEQALAQLEQQLGGVGVQSQADAINRAQQLNEIQRAGNATNIGTQTARNNNAVNYEQASKNAMFAIGSAAQDSQASAQLKSVQAQRSAISGPSFADYLGAAGNLGMGLYQSGIFGGGGGASAPSSGYNIMSGVKLTPYAGGYNNGLLSGSLSIGGNSPNTQVGNTYLMHGGANDLLSLRGIG